MADPQPDDYTGDPVEGELVDDAAAWTPDRDDPFGQFQFPTVTFGELLKHIRGRVAQYAGKRETTQSEFGALLGVDQVTISRWELGKQEPQAGHLQNIVRIAHQNGIRGLTLGRLQQVLSRDVSRFADIDPRVQRLNAYLLMEDEAFKAEFFEVVFGILHILRGVVRSDDNNPLR